MALLSSGAVVGSPDRPAKLKMAVVGDTTAFWRRTHSSVSVCRRQALVGNHHRRAGAALRESPAESALSRAAGKAARLTLKAALSELVKSPMLKPDQMNDAHQPLFNHTCRLSERHIGKHQHVTGNHSTTAGRMRTDELGAQQVDQVQRRYAQRRREAAQGDGRQVQQLAQLRSRGWRVSAGG